MGRKSRRAVYDPSISTNKAAAAGHPGELPSISAGDDPLAWKAQAAAGAMQDVDDYYGGGDAQPRRGSDEILDPKLHGLDDATNRRRRQCVLLLLVAGLLAIIISVSLLADKQQTSNQAQSSTMTAIRPQLPAIPEGLSSTCAAGKIKDNQAQYLECEQACEPAECCDYPAALDLSCLQGNEEPCMRYHMDCGNLLAPATTDAQPVAVPEAPDELDDFCAPESLATNVGIRKCAKYCLPAQCCWEEGVTSCTASQPTVCKPYAACLHLRSADKQDESISDHVNEECSAEALKTTSGQLDCKRVCEMAQCCFDTENPCPLKEKEFCAQYQACGVLHNGTVTLPDDDSATTADDSNPTSHKIHYLLKPPVGIEVACDAQYIQEPSHYSDCSNMCRHALCCKHSANTPGTCLPKYHRRCHQWHVHCGVLENVDIPEAADDGTAANAVQLPNLDASLVDNACAPDSLATFTGYNDCANYCNPAECCWKDDDISVHCRTDERCVKYTSCVNLKAMTHVDDQIKTAVDQVCKADALATIPGKSLCQEMCKLHQCCWNDQGNKLGCPFDNTKAVCDMYSACANLLEADAKDEKKALAPFPDDLVTKCFDVENKESQGECAEKCGDAACCEMPENFEQSCLGGNHDTCLEYHRACSALDASGKQPDGELDLSSTPVSAELADVCSPESLATPKGQVRCRKQCEPARCCWDSAANLKEDGITACTQDEDCSNYGPCLNIKTLEAELAQVKTEVDSKCTEELMKTGEGVAACARVCLQHACCWKDSSDDVVDDDDVAAAPGDGEGETITDDGEFDVVMQSAEGGNNDAAVKDKEVAQCVDSIICKQFEACKVLP